MIHNETTFATPISPLVIPFTSDTHEGYEGPPIVNQSTLPGYQTASNKWSWRNALIGALAGLLTGGLAGAFIGGITGGLANKSAVTLPPGEFEEATTWFKTQFTPYFNTITTQLNALLASGITVASLPEMNAIARKLCILDHFYGEINNDTFMSQAGIDFRYSLVQPYIAVFQNLIRDKAAELGAGATPINIDINSIEIPFLPQPQSGSVPCVNYAVGKGSIITSPTETAIKTATPTTTTNTTSTASNIKRPFLWLGLSAIAGALIYSLTEGKKKKK